MKSIVMLLMMVWVLPASAQLFDESPAKEGRFTHVNLQKLRKELLKELMNDELISNKKSQVFFFLKEERFKLNHQKLSAELIEKYNAMLADYKLGKGPNRLILINPDGVAVGDFWDESFSGKSEGRLSLPEIREAMAALE